MYLIDALTDSEASSLPRGSISFGSPSVQDEKRNCYYSLPIGARLKLNAIPSVISSKARSLNEVPTADSLVPAISFPCYWLFLFPKEHDRSFGSLCSPFLVDRRSPPFPFEANSRRSSYSLGYTSLPIRFIPLTKTSSL